MFYTVLIILTPLFVAQALRGASLVWLAWFGSPEARERAELKRLGVDVVGEDELEPHERVRLRRTIKKIRDADKRIARNKRRREKKFTRNQEMKA